jgi:hypothetical protein
MQSIIRTHAKRSDQIEAFYTECLDKAMGRIRRAYEEEECTYMTLRLGEIAGLKGILPPYSMHDLVKVVRLGLERAGVRAHKCRDPHHLKVEWGAALRQLSRQAGQMNDSRQKHATADDGVRFIFDGERGTVPMLDVLANPLKCKPPYLCKQEAVDVMS